MGNTTDSGNSVDGGTPQQIQKREHSMWLFDTGVVCFYTFSWEEIYMERESEPGIRVQAYNSFT